MAWGSLRRFHVGKNGSSSCWQVVVAGEPIVEAGRALDNSERLQVVVGARMWQHLQHQPCFRGTALQKDGAEGLYLLETDAPVVRVDSASLDNYEKLTKTALASTKRVQLLERWRSLEKVSEIEKRALKLYVPDVVLQGVANEGEVHAIRKLTCIFIDIELDLQRR